MGYVSQNLDTLHNRMGRIMLTEIGKKETGQKFSICSEHDFNMFRVIWKISAANERIENG